VATVQLGTVGTKKVPLDATEL